MPDPIEPSPSPEYQAAANALLKILANPDAKRMEFAELFLFQIYPLVQNMPEALTIWNRLRLLCDQFKP